MTLVSIIGDFYSSVIPVFYEFKDKIDRHIIISDDSKRDSVHARHFQRGIENFCKKHSLNIKQEFFSIDEDSVESLDRVLSYIPQNSVINTTDGLSFINTYFSVKLLPKGVNFISYDIFDNEMILLNAKSVKRIKPKKSVPVLDYFLLRDIEVKSVGDKAFAKKYARAIKDIFELHHSEFKKFKYELTAKNTLPKRNKFKAVYYLLDKMNAPKTYSGLFKFATGTLFEYYVYLRLKELGFDDLEVGVSIQNDEVVNEFDVLVMENNHLHIVECKHKNDKRLFIGDLIYKYYSLRNIIDYDAKAAIISLVETYSEHHIKRALSYNIGLFGIKQIGRVREFLKEGEYDSEKFIYT